MASNITSVYVAADIVSLVDAKNHNTRTLKRSRTTHECVGL